MYTVCCFQWAKLQIASIAVKKIIVRIGADFYIEMKISALCPLWQSHAKWLTVVHRC